MIEDWVVWIVAIVGTIAYLVGVLASLGFWKKSDDELL